MLSRSQALIIGLVVILMVIASLYLLVWSHREKPETVVIFKTTEISPKTTNRDIKSSNNETDVLAGGTSEPDQESEDISEEYSDVSSSETEKVDMWEFFDDFGDISDGIGVNQESEIDSEFINSPFGFGNFPEIPRDFPRQDVWDYFWKLYDKDQQAAENYELINRVVIQLWKEGGRAPGGVLKRGRVYPLDDNTAYITWKTAYGPDGETKRYISNLTTTPGIARRYAESHFRQGLIPSGVNVVEHSAGGYDPYNFVNQ